MNCCEENHYQPKLVCNKGNMLLHEIKIPYTIEKAYNLQFEIKNLNMNKVNIELLITNQIYELLEKVNEELIENIYILNTPNNQDTDICIVFKQIAKEVGIKKKYILGVQDKDSNDDYQTQLNKYNEELQKYIEKNTYNKNFYENDCWIKESYKKRYIKQISCLCPDLHKLVKVYKTHLAWVHM